LSDSPIPELDEQTADPLVQRRALAWTSTVIAVAAIFLLVFNATALHSWASSLKPSDATVELAAVAGGWEDATARLGLTAPRAFVHDVWAKQRALTWGQNNGAPGSADPPP
jgi:hypothetical protein